MLRRNFISILGSIPFLNLNKIHKPIESLQVGGEITEIISKTKDVVRYRKIKNGKTYWYITKLIDPEKGVWQECIHRDDGPAKESPDGTKMWYQNGNIHRADGPAIECPDGTKKWCQNGRFHRLDGPAIEYPDGTKEWFQNGKRHREHGPAIEHANGKKEWYQNGERHREDGPAVELPSGTEIWYWHGINIWISCEQ